MRWIGPRRHGRHRRRGARSVPRIAGRSAGGRSGGPSRSSSPSRPSFSTGKRERTRWRPSPTGLERDRLRRQGLRLPLRMAGWAEDELGAKLGMPMRRLHLRLQGSSDHHLHLRVLLAPLLLRDHPDRIVQGMAWVMQQTMKVSGAEALCVAANVFIGQTEAPVMIAPYIAGHDDVGAADDDDRRHGARLRRRDARLRDDGRAAEVPDHGVGHGGARERS